MADCKGNLLNRRATRWTIFAVLILTYGHLTKYILKMLADTFFFPQNENWRVQFFSNLRFRIVL